LQAFSTAKANSSIFLQAAIFTLAKLQDVSSSDTTSVQVLKSLSLSRAIRIPGSENCRAFFVKREIRLLFLFLKTTEQLVWERPPLFFNTRNSSIWGWSSGIEANIAARLDSLFLEISRAKVSNLIISLIASLQS